MSISPQSIRSRYSAGQYFIEGKAREVGQIKVRTMNFGQHWRGEEVESIPYQIDLPVQLAIDIINWQLPEYAKDSQEHFDEDSLIDQLLKENDWKTDGHWLMTEGPELLRQMVVEEFAHEMILQWFGDGPTETDGYVLNSCNQTELIDQVLRITGYCRKTSTSSAYQDF